MKINARTLFSISTTMSLDSRSLFLMDAWHLWKDRCLAFIFRNARILFPTTTAMSPDSRSLFSMDAWDYENKCQDSFPYIYCYFLWQSQIVLDGCLAFMKRNTITPFPTSTAMSLDSSSLFFMDAWRLFSSMQGLFSQHLLLCPPTVAVCSRWMAGIYDDKCQDSFNNVYCYVPWQSQFVLDGCLAFMKINNRTLFPTSTAMSLDSRSLLSMDAWRLFS